MVSSQTSLGLLILISSALCKIPFLFAKEPQFSSVYDDRSHRLSSLVNTYIGTSYSKNQSDVHDYGNTALQTGQVSKCAPSPAVVCSDIVSYYHTTILSQSYIMISITN